MQLQIKLAGTIGYGIGFVNSAGAGSGCLKRVEKSGDYQRDMGLVGFLNQKR
jgi:hypothetical protein